MLRLTLSLLLAGLVISTSAIANETTTVVEKRVVITTPAPVATCTKIDAHWEGEVWVESHNICKYENRTEGVAWVNDYWSCTKSTSDGTCTAWTLVPGHWVATLQ